MWDSRAGGVFVAWVESSKKGFTIMVPRVTDQLPEYTNIILRIILITIN